MLLALIVAGSLALPNIDPREFRERIGRVTGTWEFFVSPDGKILECKVLDGRNDKVCAKAIGHDLGDGAMSSDGRRIHGSVVISIIRTSGGPPRGPGFEGPSHLDIGVARMPGSKDRQRLSLTVYIDAVGKVRQCLQWPDADATLSRIACEQASAHTFDVKRDEAGQPVEQVTVLKVDFVREDAGNGRYNRPPFHTTRPTTSTSAIATSTGS
jgi:hypothetical protein